MLFRYRFYLSRPFSLLKMYRQFKKNPYKDRKVIARESFARLKALCIYCGKHVPYYRKLFAEIGFSPEDMKSYKDFKRIPILDKNTVRKHAKELQSDEIEKMNTVLCSTSGSTGTPLHIYLDSNVNMAVFCKLWHLWQQDSRWQIGKVLLTLDGDNTEYVKREWYFNPKNRFLYFTPCRMKRENIRMYYDLVQKYQPATMKGYPSAVYIFGKYLEEAGLSLSFNTIFLHSENLLDFQKKYFEKFFKARVVNQYGNNEKAGMIHSCIHNKLHSQDDYAYHEILDRNGTEVLPGEDGRLVCTNLYNYSMPLLRYDTRDIASFSEETCTCGSRFKVIKEITGRASDVIYTNDGRIISLIDSAFWNSDHIELANIYQPEKGSIIVRLVIGDLYTNKDERILMKSLRERCGKEMKIKIEYVKSEDIPRTPAGKVRFILSDVNSEELYK